MREKWICLLLSGALALGLTACAAGSGGDGRPAPAVETGAVNTLGTVPAPGAASLPEESDAPETDAPSTTPERGSVDTGGLPPRDYQPWQKGYMDFLSALAQADKDTRGQVTETGEYYWPAYEGLAVDQRGVHCLDAGEPLPMTQVMAMGSDHYSLYDVDGDGVPELFVQFGNCEANFTTHCYTFRDGQVVCIGEFDTGHSSLYTDPGRSAVVRSAGHMGCKEVYEYPMEDGRLTGERVLFTEEDVEFYTDTEDIVPGARYIAPTRVYRGEDDHLWFERPLPTWGQAMLLPIIDWYDGPAATGSGSEQARTAILAALNGETGLYGYSGEGYYGDVGPTTWAEYVQGGGAYPYDSAPLEIQGYVWQDMNGDGQEECVLLLRAEDEYQAQLTVVLSEQGGEVYAYGFGYVDLSEFETVDAGYPYRGELYTDGVMQDHYGGTSALSFWKDQCCQYAVTDHAAGEPVQWQKGPVNG